ncbi:MAG: hypothetical protein ACP5N1_01620 [Candidatus Woesearchaeota archaeon]
MKNANKSYHNTNKLNNSTDSNNIIKRDKKGIIDVQFNWIFILIAGVVIFAFIIGIVFSQKNYAEKQSDIQLSNQITTLLKGKHQTADVYSEINFPSNTMNFQCELTGNNSYFTFKIANANRVELPIEVMFAPREITTNKLVVWTQQFDIGFPVTVFSYISSPDLIILIIDDETNTAVIEPDLNVITPDNSDQSYTSYAKILNDSIPSNITHKIISLSELGQYNNYNNKKIVCFKDTCNPTDMTDYNYISVYPYISTGTDLQTQLFGHGNITFHRKGPISNVNAEVIRPYITKAGLFGAIFSDASDYYVCQMSRAISHYNMQVDLTERRLTLIEKAMNNTCNAKINATINNNIKNYKNATLNYQNLTNLYNNIAKLDIRNSDLTLSSCPKIY